MILLHNAAQVVTPLTGGDFCVITNGAVVAKEDRIVFVGSTDEALQSFSSAERIDVSGKVLLPGFVDSHTHAVFAGTRADEFESRLTVYLKLYHLKS